MLHTLPTLVVKQGGNGGEEDGCIHSNGNPHRLTFSVNGTYQFKRIHKASDANLTLVSTVGLGGDMVIAHYVLDKELPGFFGGAVTDFIDRLVTTLKVINFQDKENLWLVEVHWKDLAGQHGHRSVALEPWEKMLHGMLSTDVFNYQSYLPIEEAKAISDSN